MLSMGACALGLAGCGKDDYGYDVVPDETGTTLETLICNGACVETPPATFTGPSLFWLGAVELAPECPPETPFQGLQGYVVGIVPVTFARECRITPSDLCDTEGLTCAPLPPEDFHVCVHRDKDAPDCPPDYNQLSGMQAAAST